MSDRPGGPRRREPELRLTTGDVGDDRQEDEPHSARGDPALSRTGSRSRVATEASLRDCRREEPRCSL